VKYALFLGCTIPEKMNGYETSSRVVARELGVELIDLPNSGCCGSPIVRSMDEQYWTLLSARILATAEEMGLDLCCLCNGCVGSIIHANEYLKKDKIARERINDILSDFDLEYKGTLEVKHLLKILYEDVGLSRIKEHLEIPFKDGLKIGAYYGCHMLRPSELTHHGDPERPTQMDEIINLTGAIASDYEGKISCCGAPVLSNAPDVAWRLTHRIISTAHDADLKALITICPFCSLSLDLNQIKVKELWKLDYDIPVLHLPQLLGLSMGFGVRELGLFENRVKSAMKFSQFLVKDD
jgi:heterodisulfide reductase subunit B